MIDMIFTLDNGRKIGLDSRNIVEIEEMPVTGAEGKSVCTLITIHLRGSNSNEVHEYVVAHPIDEVYESIQKIDKFF